MRREPTPYPKEDTVPEVSDLEAAQGEARRRVAAIGGSQRALPTPCSEWDIRALVVHMIEGSRMALRLLCGATGAEARSVFGASHGPDLGAELDAAFADELATFGEPGALDQTVHHPAAGDIPATVLLEFRTIDYLLHSWDLARAAGGDDALPEDLVASAWATMQPMAEAIGTIGPFGTGPSGTVGEDAPLQQRLLDLSGRRP